jgi:hypothetical protein
MLKYGWQSGHLGVFPAPKLMLLCCIHAETHSVQCLTEFHPFGKPGLVKSPYDM